MTGVLLRGVFGLVLLAVCVEGVTVIIRLVRCRYSVLRDPCIFILVLIGAVSLCSIMQHYVMGTKYLIGRTALVLLPLFTLLAVRQMGRLIDGTGSAWRRRTAGVVLIMTGVVLPIHFVRAVNVTHLLECQFDATTKQALEYLDDHIDREEDAPGRVTLGIDHLFLPTVRYYRYRGYLSGIGRVVYQNPEGCDYQYLLEEHAQGVLSSGKVEVLKRYPLSKSVLCKRVDG